MAPANDPPLDNPPDYSFSSQLPSSAQAPRLPPRAESSQFLATDPPPYSGPYTQSKGAFQDSRFASTQSLVPDYSEQASRRRLLIIYIHGYRGTEASFRKLPAHVHRLVSVALAETHVVHTKIYPRYYTKGDMAVLVDAFSKWLAPHEDDHTDIVLCGHSLGGLMAADIALCPPPDVSPQALFRHHILGTMSFDAPFLGMSPSVIKSGIQSLFSKYEEPADPSAASSSAPQPGPARVSTIAAMATDPTFNPDYTNDVKLPQPREMMKEMLHFVGKHTDNVFSEGLKAWKTQWAYGRSIVTDIHGMKSRYSRIRALEEEDERGRTLATNGRRPVPRIRFVNYYNACTSPERPEKERKSKSPSPSRLGTPTQEARNQSAAWGSILNSQNPSTIDLVGSPPDLVQNPGRSPRISLEEHRGSEVINKDLPTVDSTDPSKHPDPKYPASIVDSVSQMSLSKAPTQSSLFTDGQPASLSFTSITSDNTTNNLPEIPPIPQEPPFLDPTQFSDKDDLRSAQKELAQALKTYKQAVKDRNTALKEREKHEKKQEKESKRQQKAAASQERPQTITTPSTANIAALQASLAQTASQPVTGGPSAPPSDSDDEDAPTLFLQQPKNSQQNSLSSPTASTLDTSSLLTTTTSATTLSSTNPSNTNPNKKKKKKKTSKFCILPSKIDGQPDRTWIKLLMENTNPPAAHSAMFLPSSKTYELLVGDIASRLEEWVNDAGTVRLVRQFAAEEEEVNRGLRERQQWGVTR